MTFSATLAPLMEQKRWVVWKFETVRNKPTKVPYQVNGRKAKNNDPSTWTDFTTAINAQGFSGVGFCLMDSEFAAFDLDNCRDLNSGEIKPWARKLIERAGSYCEITISGTGLRIIGIGTGTKIHRKQTTEDGGSLESYRKAERYIVMTGNVIEDRPLANIDQVMDAVVKELDEITATTPLRGARRGRKQEELPAELKHMLFLQGDKPANYPSRSELFFAFINAALRKNVDENVIVDACLDQTYAGCSIFQHVDDNGGETYVKKQIEKAANDAPADDQERVIIKLVSGQMDKIWRATEQALIAKEQPVYVRGNHLVQPLWRWEKAGNSGDEVLTARFERLNVPRLADIVAHHAVRFKKFSIQKKGWVDVDPPDRLIEQIIEMGHWRFPSVVGIVNSPTMRPDFSLLTQEGYDPSTELWYKASDKVKLPEIKEAPSREDGKQALARINKLLRGFAFDGEVARAAAVAGIMTTVLRGMLKEAVPIFVIIATEPRTGKTFLVELIAVIATGHKPVPTALATTKEENEKRIETAALSGRPIMHLNNIENGMELQSQALAQLSTEGQLTIRKLGRHTEGLCDNRATTIFLNGNNISVSQDLTLRTVVCQLDAKREDPEKRKFEFDPIKQVRKDRGTYLADVFTIVRAFKASGFPEQSVHNVAGYETWSRLVQQPLVWLGMADPLGDMSTMRAVDTTAQTLTRLIEVLKKHFAAGQQFTVADCLRLAEEQETDARGRERYKRPDLRDIMIFHNKVDGKEFGSVLRRHRGRINDGWRVQIVKQTRNKTNLYRLEKQQSDENPWPAEVAEPAPATDGIPF